MTVLYVCVLVLKQTTFSMFVFSDVEGYVVHWHVTKSQPGLVVKEDRQTFCAAYSPDMRHFSTVGSDRYLIVYSEATGKQTHQFQARCVIHQWEMHMNI